MDAGPPFHRGTITRKPMKPKTTRRKTFSLKPKLTERQRRKLLRDIAEAIRQAWKPIKT